MEGSTEERKEGMKNKQKEEQKERGWTKVKKSKRMEEQKEGRDRWGTYLCRVGRWLGQREWRWGRMGNKVKEGGNNRRIEKSNNVMENQRNQEWIEKEARTTRRKNVTKEPICVE